MRLLSSFKHFYYSFDIAAGFLLCFWVSQFFFQICTYVQRSAKILQICTDSQRSKTWDVFQMVLNFCFGHFKHHSIVLLDEFFFWNLGVNFEKVSKMKCYCEGIGFFNFLHFHENGEGVAKEREERTTEKEVQTSACMIGGGVEL